MTHSVPRKNGFTIVELIIIIAVIGILAAITIVSYSAVTDNAKAQTAKTDAQTAAAYLNKYKAENGAYPANLDNLESFPKVDSDYQYNYNASNGTYCITASVEGASAFVVSGNSQAQEGGCAGHGVDGQGTITNLARNPKGLGAAAQYASSGWFNSLCGANATDVPNVTWNTQTGWHKMSWTGTGCNTLRMSLNTAELQNGETYRVSVLAGNNGAASTSFGMDFADVGGATYTLSAGQMTTISFTATRSTYDSIYNFIDINPNTASGVLIKDVMVTKGTDTHDYRDGESPNWVWNGTANSSSSTGPPTYNTTKYKIHRYDI